MSVERPAGANTLHDVVVLFVEKQSHYKVMDRVDTYDVMRDATHYAGTLPVVAHPPCRTWGVLSHMASSAPPAEHNLGPWAVAQVRLCGGVLEHPKGSRLFEHCGCPKPREPPDAWGGWTVDVDQWHWGHKAAKPTRLYIVGVTELPAVPVRDGRPTYCITQSHSSWMGTDLFKHRVTDWERQATPPAFGRWLVELARRCSKHNISHERTLIGGTLDGVVGTGAKEV